MYLLSVVRKVYHDGVAVVEEADDAVDNHVVVGRGVQIGGHFFALRLVERFFRIGAHGIVLLYVLCLEAGETFGIAVAAISVLPEEMEDTKIAVGAFQRLSLPGEIVDEFKVVGKFLVVAVVEDIRLNAWVVDKAHRSVPLAEVVVGGKLIAEVDNVEAARAQDGGEERLVAPGNPFFLVGNRSHGKKIFEVCVVPLSEEITSLKTNSFPFSVPAGPSPSSNRLARSGFVLYLPS